MTEHYVTLFDSTFLPQGLALHHSLLEHGGDCLLWVLCLDEQCLTTLQRLNLPQMRLLDLAKLETPELLAVKPSRTRAEYCWTLTPWSVQWVFEADSTAKRVTYLDADIFFLGSPSPIFEEFEISGKKVLVTPHDYSPEYDESFVSGRYCVQFLSFMRDDDAQSVLSWWRDACIDWCFSRPDTDRFGDQKYLEAWLKIFPEFVHTLQKAGIALAPWNATRFPPSDGVFYHFHGLRFATPSKATLGDYVIPRSCIRQIYMPYLRVIRKIRCEFNLDFKPQCVNLSLLAKLKRRIKRVYFTLVDKVFSPFYIYY